MSTTRRSGPPRTGPAQELIDSGFALESADAPHLHDGLNLADLAQVLDLHRRKIIPEAAARDLAKLLLEVRGIPAEEFPYDPSHGEPYNSREQHFVRRLGDTAGWLHAGRPRREAARIALRLKVRSLALQLADEVAHFARAATATAAEHVDTLMPDQTYLQQAQPSTFAHYLLSFVPAALRDGERLIGEFDWVNQSPGGAGCVNGTRLMDDRGYLADALGFSGVIENTRDAMWQVDGFVHLLATTASLVSTQSKLAEDLEIWSSTEFDFVDLDDSYTRSSVLMPQKRNPYSLSIIRGAAGVLQGRLAGFLAVTKTPSARSDNLIFAYGEVPRALDLAIRVTRLMTGVVGTLKVNAKRMRDVLDAGYTQATDLTELITQRAGVDYRTAYVVVGRVVRAASEAGIPGREITGAMIDEFAEEESGHPWGLTGDDLSAALDPRKIIASRASAGGAATPAVLTMIENSRNRAKQLTEDVEERRRAIDDAEARLIADAEHLLDSNDDPRRSS